MPPAVDGAGGWRRRAAIATMLAVLGVSAAAPVRAAEDVPVSLRILGFVEHVRILESPPLRVKARLDTGARTSSLTARDPVTTQRDGVEWIAFAVDDPDDGVEAVRYQLPVERYVRIKRHDGSHQRRPVVRMRFCLADVALVREVSLIDRSELMYPMLIGRNFLAGHILVDASDSLTTDPACPADGGAREHGKNDSGDEHDDDGDEAE